MRILHVSSRSENGVQCFLRDSIKPLKLSMTHNTAKQISMDFYESYNGDVTMDYRSGITITANVQNAHYMIRLGAIIINVD